MDLTVGQAKLKNAMKSLLVHWDGTKQHWNDPVREEFERDHLEPFEPRVHATLSAMDRLSSVLHQARRACE